MKWLFFILIGIVTTSLSQAGPTSYITLNKGGNLFHIYIKGNEYYEFREVAAKHQDLKRILILTPKFELRRIFSHNQEIFQQLTLRSDNSIQKMFFSLNEKNKNLELKSVRVEPYQKWYFSCENDQLAEVKKIGQFFSKSGGGFDCKKIPDFLNVISNKVGDELCLSAIPELSDKLKDDIFSYVSQPQNISCMPNEITSFGPPPSGVIAGKDASPESIFHEIVHQMSLSMQSDGQICTVDTNGPRKTELKVKEIVQACFPDKEKVIKSDQGDTIEDLHKALIFSDKENLEKCKVQSTQWNNLEKLNIIYEGSIVSRLNLKLDTIKDLKDYKEINQYFTKQIEDFCRSPKFKEEVACLTSICQEIHTDEGEKSSYNICEPDEFNPLKTDSVSVTQNSISTSTSQQVIKEAGLGPSSPPGAKGFFDGKSLIPSNQSLGGLLKSANSVLSGLVGKSPQGGSSSSTSVIIPKNREQYISISKGPLGADIEITKVASNSSNLAGMSSAVTGGAEKNSGSSVSGKSSGAARSGQGRTPAGLASGSGDGSGTDMSASVGGGSGTGGGSSKPTVAKTGGSGATAIDQCQNQSSACYMREYFLKSKSESEINRVIRSYPQALRLMERDQYQIVVGPKTYGADSAKYIYKFENGRWILQKK
ncbi:MAG: hypothetical protein BroJett041_23550 [Candidatus Jettenia caeni]|nr:MAG: hypothetical protein BroJett041_23550 [Candidatus Jettenia caeni]